MGVEWREGGMDGWMNGCMNVYAYACMIGGMGGCMNVRMTIV